MNIVLKPEARRFLETQKGTITWLLIDGSLDAEYVKTCGCCGPPPSPDYKVTVMHANDVEKVHGALMSKKFEEVRGLVPVLIERQLFDALDAARMSVVIFYLETTGAEEGAGNLVAKLI